MTNEQDLDAILDDCLDDFTPSVTKTKNAFASAASAKLPLPPSGTDSAHMNELYSDEFLAQLSKGMESMLMQQPGNNDDASVDSLPSSALLGGSSGIGGGGLETAEPAKLKEMHNDFKEFLRGLELEAVGSSNSDKNQANEGVVEEGAATATINITSEGSSRSFQSKITSTLNKLKDSDGLVNSQLGDELKQGLSFDDAAMAQMMNELEGLIDNDGNFGSMLSNLLEDMVSRELMYDPMLELAKKYPEWLEKNQSSVSADDLSRYKKQLHFIQEIIKTFESIPGGGEPEDDKKKIIVDLMQQMQDCGNPPDEITKELNESGIQDFISGNINGTTAAGAMPTGVPPECAQM